MPQIISVSSTYRKAQLQDGNSVKRLRVGAGATLCITANTPRKSSTFFALRARPCLSPFCRLQHLWMTFPVAALHSVEHCPANGLHLLPRFRTSAVAMPVTSQPTTLNVVMTITSKPSHHYRPFPVLRPFIPTASGCIHPLEHTAQLRPMAIPHATSHTTSRAYLPNPLLFHQGDTVRKAELM